MKQATVRAATAADAMVRHPKVHPATLTVGEARHVLTDDHVHMVLLTQHGHLVGTLLRDDVPAAAADEDLALRWAQLRGRTVTSSTPVEVVRQRLVELGQRRAAVVGDDGQLLGLVCLKRKLSGFCSDADVAARRCEHATMRIG